MGSYQEKHSKQGWGWGAALSLWLSIGKSFQGFGVILLSTERGIFLIDVNVSYIKITSTQFSDALLCLLSLKNNQIKIINMLKRHIMGWQILHPKNANQRHRKVLLILCISLMEYIYIHITYIFIYIYIYIFLYKSKTIRETKTKSEEAQARHP